jgi:hypothetical protein
MLFESEISPRKQHKSETSAAHTLSNLCSVAVSCHYSQ